MPKPLKRPSNDTSLEDADVLRLTFRKEIADPNKHDIFYPKSTFSSGRNALLRLALGLEKGKGEMDCFFKAIVLFRTSFSFIYKRFPIFCLLR